MRFLGSILLSLPLLICLESSSYALSKQQYVCPNTLNLLIERMLRDLPSYANRVIQRSRDSFKTDPLKTYVLAAGASDFQPLALKNRQYKSRLNDQPQQVFFTTLERSFAQHGFQDSQNYHWLFLSNLGGSWKLVMLYTRLGSFNSQLTSSPPEENSEGIIGQAISFWLRDCQTGNLR